MRAMVQFLYMNSNIFYGLILMVLLLVKLQAKDHSKAQREFQVTSQVSKVLLSFEFLFLCLLSVFVLSFIGANQSLQALDQVAQVRRLIEMVRVARWTQSSGRAEREACGRAPSSSGRRAMNERLVVSLMQYKLFVALMRNGVHKSFEIFISGPILMLACPVIGLLHGFMARQTAEHRLFTICLSCGLLIPCDITLLPLCHLHSRCLELYRSLGHLLAHAVRTNQTGPIYDSHALECLRKELGRPEETIRCFATSNLGLACTYQLLCRLHFWFGLLLLLVVVLMSGEQRWQQQQQQRNQLDSGQASSLLLSALF